MGRLIEEKINNFSGGISDDPRQPVSNAGSLIKHFDIFQNPFKLIPVRDTEADTSTSVSSTDLEQYLVRDFILALSGRLYGLGENASGQPKVVFKADPTTGNWTLPATAEGNAARIGGSFIEWVSSLWFFQGTTQVARWAIDSTVTNTVGTVGTITTVAQSIVGADGNMYMFYNNKVVRVSSANAVTDDVFSAIPTDMRITAAARWGSYLAIAVSHGTSATALPSGRSQVYIWDYVATSTAVDVIDWGEGDLKVLGNIEGRLVGVSDKYLSNAISLSQGSMVVKMWAGGTPQVMKEIVANQLVTADTATARRFPRSFLVKDNRLYWAASVPFLFSTSTESTYHLGIWCFGRKNANSEFALSIEVVEEATASANYFISSIGNAGNYWFIAHSAQSAGLVRKTNDSSSFTYTSEYITQIRNAGDSSVTKTLKGVTIYTDPLPAAAVITIQYAINQETTFTTIFTSSTDDSISASAVNIASSGAQLPEYKEILFRITSTGGGEITGLSWQSDLLQKDIFTRIFEYLISFIR